LNRGELVKTTVIVPATVEFLDIAGLVRGASKGEGLGNQFLANIRETDTVVQVVRCFEDESVVHVEGGVDPVARHRDDSDRIGTGDLATVERRREKAQKSLKSGDKVARLNWKCSTRSAGARSRDDRRGPSH
jgi:ribosome-binding ATPase YchF (GTP1/OBG family)